MVRGHDLQGALHQASLLLGIVPTEDQRTAREGVFATWGHHLTPGCPSAHPRASGSVALVCHGPQLSGQTLC